MAIEVELEFKDVEVRKFLLAVTSHYKEIEEKSSRYVSLISAIVFRDILDHFKTEQGPEGAWAPWSNIYKIHMDSIGRGNNKKLQFSGRLRQTFTPEKYRRDSRGILWFNNAKTKSGFPYAKAHDEGADKLPARPFMWLSEKRLDDISEQTLQFLMEER